MEWNIFYYILRVLLMVSAPAYNNRHCIYLKIFEQVNAISNATVELMSVRNKAFVFVYYWDIDEGGFVSD